jgi:hypothetical protein
MELASTQAHVPTNRDVMRKVFTEWAAVSGARGSAQDCIQFLQGTCEADTLEANDWSQIQKLAEHLARTRRAQAGRG